MLFSLFKCILVYAIHSLGSPGRGGRRRWRGAGLEGALQGEDGGGGARDHRGTVVATAAAAVVAAISVVVAAAASAAPPAWPEVEHAAGQVHHG